ncbi:MAG: ribonuclease HII [Alphaproteobacteria bacterium]|nr:ribonuclease HII [Alphaproteobacteria bacterium]
MPDFSLETALRPGGRVAGLDEVGRGPWAGPVTACAVVIDRTRFPDDLANALDDSKRLTAAKRDRLYALLISTVEYAIAEASVAEIDSLNILQASLLAMRRAVQALPNPPDAALVDGNRDPGLGLPTQCIVKGDGMSLSIAAASIIAKVTRDRQMARLAETYPGYGWERNAGYGVKAHRQALAALGVTPHHRRSFAPIRALLA